MASIKNRVEELSTRLASLLPATASRGEAQRRFGEVFGSARLPQRYATARQVGVSGAGGKYDAIITAAAGDHGLDADLVHAVVRAESDYNPWCKSRAGAQGLMQLMPGTAAALGVSDPWDPEQNIQGGTQYLAAQLARFGSVELALAAYNAGPGAVRRYGGVPPYPETQQYLERVARYLAQRKQAGQ